MKNTFLSDLKYASLLAGRIENYTAKANNIFLGRCHICGDSAKNKRIRRFYVYPSKDRTGLQVYCQKCKYSSSLSFYLKTYHTDLHAQYMVDAFMKKEDRPPDPILDYAKPKHEQRKGILNGLKRISQLDPNHKAKQYIVDRKLPPKSHSKLYFTNNFSKWINTLIPDKFDFKGGPGPKIDPRIVIPLFDRRGEVFAVQGRALLNSQTQRYITIKFNEDLPKIFGLDTVDPNRRIYVLEGPFDSLFLPNAIAMTGGDCSHTRLLEILGCDKDRLVFVYDNQRRHKEVCKTMATTIEEGFNVCLWPASNPYKDVNDMVKKGGMEPANVQLQIDQHTYSGLTAKLQFSKWRKDV